MVPLFAIAFVVAIICTGVWYGLFAGKLRSSIEIPGHAIVVAARDLDRGTVVQRSDLRVSEVHGVLGGAYSKPEDAAGATLLTAMKANEPLLEERVSPRVSEAGGGGGPVPAGMRAVTMHVSQSESVLNLLRPGSRVDLQALAERNGSTEIRTILENVQILAVSAADANGNRPASAVLTALIPARDTDLVALADAGSRIRVALRNPLDGGTTPRRSLALAALFSGSGRLGTDQALETNPPGSAAGWDHPIQLHVWVLSVSDDALEQLRLQSVPVASDNSWRLAAFHSSEAPVRLVRSLELKQRLEIVAGERLMAGVGRPITYRAGSRPDRLSLQFLPEWLPTGKLGLEVKSEALNRYDLPEVSSFWMEGSSDQPPGQPAPARLFPGRSWEHKHLVVFVSTRIVQPAYPLALAGPERGR
jgi:Flp pilus assembly protein CpaB